MGLLFCLPGFVVSATEDKGAPVLKVSLSPATQPTKKVQPGTREVELLSVQLLPENHPGRGPLLQSLTFHRNGDQGDLNPFVRYKLLYDEVILSRMALPEGDVLTFENLDLWLPNDEVAELRILGDVAFGATKGRYTFRLDSEAALQLKEMSEDSFISGRFPVISNKVLIGYEEKASPPSDCNLREEPVCGEDGKSYFNLCIPYQKGIRIIDDRPCVELPPAPEYCSRIYNPVCGTDGITYSNDCVLKKEKVSFDYAGVCFPDDFGPLYSLIEAVDLFEKKKNQLAQLRPRISDDAEAELHYISSLLVSYHFTQGVRLELLSKITDFFNFSRNPSDRTVLESEIHNLLLAVILSQSASDQEKYELGTIPFVDVGEEQWYFGAVDFLKKKGWAVGYQDKDGQETGQYRPENYVTKAEITKLALEAKGLAIESINQGAFRPKNPLARYRHWATKLIGYAEEQEYSIWKDFPNPDKKASREEVVQLVLEVFQIVPPEVFNKSSFSDVAPTSQRFPFIEYAKQLGIIGGYPDGTFKGQESIIRAEAAKIVKNAYEIFWGK